MELNTLHIAALIKLINASPFFRNLDMTIEEMGIGYSLVTIELKEKHLSPYGAIQGGVYSSIIDTAAYWAPYAELAEDLGLITMDVSVHHLSSIQKGRIWARGERIKIGKTTCLAQVTVKDEKDKLLAYGSSKLLLTKDLQLIPQMMGYAAAGIPAKFV